MSDDVVRHHRRAGWKVRSLPAAAGGAERRRLRPSASSDENCVGASDGAGAGPSAPSLDGLVREFETDGFLSLSSLLTPWFVSMLREECMEAFRGVFEWLHLTGEAEFAHSHRRLLRRCKCTEGEEDDDKPIRDASSRRDADEKKDTSHAEARSQPIYEYEYPIGQGLKNGYRELVMRSPGRYELALLVDVLPNNFVADVAGDYEGKWLLSPKMLDSAREQRSNEQNGTSSSSTEDTSNNNTACSKSNGTCGTESCLKMLIGWVQNPTGYSNSNGGINGGVHKEHRFQADQENIKRFMKLVDAIFPPSVEEAPTNGSNSADSIHDTGDKLMQSNEEQMQSTEVHRLINLSLLVATPGCPDQPWHADGGHVSLSKHEKCHVFNVFVPLVDVPLSMGPTELRPGTHFHTRNLAPMMLAARARGTLRPPVVPEMEAGDALVFDYRVLHRGRTNASDVANVAADDAAADTSFSARPDASTDIRGGDPSKAGGGGQANNNKSNIGGRDRPVLVLTFARSWFVDVCNFPKRSIFGLDGEGRQCDKG